MTTLATARPTIQRPEPEFLVDDAQLAAAAFLARYSGRTLDGYRHDLRGFFQWTADNAVPVLEATRPHIELYRAWMDQRGLAASTIDGRPPRHRRPPRRDRRRHLHLGRPSQASLAA
jgi:hypothetical protein